MLERYEVIDISQPVSGKTACFPGDVPFSKKITRSFRQSNVVNLSAMTMSPHVGTHADAPIHCYGDMSDGHDMAGMMPLLPYIGPAFVIDVSPLQEAISLPAVKDRLSKMPEFPRRLLFKTAKSIVLEVFAQAYAFFTVELVEYLSANGAILAGIDTPSVDSVQSTTLPAHHALIKAGMSWLENLDLTEVEPGHYFLSALPLKLMELEASPVRAVLLKEV